jgi:hypothetical protein
MANPSHPTSGDPIHMLLEDCDSQSSCAENHSQSVTAG